VQEVLIGVIPAALTVAGGCSAAANSPLPSALLFHLDLLPVASRQEYLCAAPALFAASSTSGDQSQ
jgi:hypothetical protein